MDKAKAKSVASFVICALFSLLSAVTFVMIQIGLHKRFSYFTVISVGRMVLYSLMVLLPFIVGVLLIVFRSKIGKKTKISLYALLALSVILSFVFTIAFSVMPPCASETNKRENYLVFDEDCPAYYIPYKGMFPKQIPSAAENVQYYYTYRNYPDLSYDIFAQWTLPRAEYNAEKTRMIELFPDAVVEETGDFNVVYVSDEKKTTLDHVAFAFNDKTFTFRYMVSYIENVDVNGLEPYYERLSR